MGSAAFWIALASVAFAAVLLTVAALTLARVLRAAPERAPGGAAPRVVERTPVRDPSPTPSRQAEVDRAQEEARRARQLATLASTLDLDELLQQVLRAAVSVSGADAAALVFPQSGAPPIEKTLNLAPEEAAPSLEGLWSENRARSVAVRYRYGGRETGGAR